MKLLLVVNASPWGSTRAVTAFRLARAVLAAGHEIPAVFFRGEGVYNALGGTVADAGTPELAPSWSELAGDGKSDLMVCQASVRRRLNAPVKSPFREAGLVEFNDRLAGCDRLVTL